MKRSSARRNQLAVEQKMYYRHCSFQSLEAPPEVFAQMSTRSTGGRLLELVLVLVLGWALVMVMPPNSSDQPSPQDYKPILESTQEGIFPVILNKE